MTTNMGQLSPIMGAAFNQSGSNMGMPSVGGSTMPSIGSSAGNPLLPQFPGGQSTFGVSAPVYGGSGGGFMSGPQFGAVNATPTNMQAPGQGGAGAGGATGPYNTSATGALSGSNLTSLLGGMTNPYSGETNQQAASNFVSSMKKAGFSDGVAGALWNFLQNGAGFNPQVAQAMIASMQPQIAQGQANVMGQFGNAGLGDSSAAALGLSNYDSQVQLNEGQIFANMYEQSVNNYMNVLLAGKGNAEPNNGAFGNIMQGVQGLASLGGAATGAGKLAGSLADNGGLLNVLGG